MSELNPLNPEATQQRINEVQTIYREWLVLQPKLEQAKADW